MDKNSILKNRTSLPVFRILERTTKFDKVKLMKFYNNLEALLKTDMSYAEVSEKLKVCLVVDPKETTGKWNLFDKNVFIAKLKNDDFQKSNILVVSCDGNVVKEDNKLIDNPVEATDLSKVKKDKIIIFIDIRQLHFFVNAELIIFIQDIIDALRPGQIIKECLPAREYRKLIENHFKKRVEGEKGFKYWKNKSKRILFDRPEVVFHKPLWSYLNNYVLGAKVDSEISLDGTSDRADIRILSFDSKELHIIEIKCLGKSGDEKQQEKSDDWANHGIAQLKIYLDEDMDSTIGLLVLYDGRKDDKDINWIDKKNWHKKTDPNPMRFYLISESASKRASAELQKIKNK